MRRRLLITAALILGGLFLSACQDPDLNPAQGQWDAATWDAASWR